MKALFVSLASAAMLLGAGIPQAGAAQPVEPALAQQNTGCGLGSVIIKNNDTLLGQTVMVTLNGILGNQTFGITSGTSNCKQATTVVSIDTHNFVAGNMDGIAMDMAMGEGEALDTLAELMEVPVDERSRFFSVLQANFSSVFTSEAAQPADVIDNIVAVTS